MEDYDVECSALTPLSNDSEAPLQHTGKQQLSTTGYELRLSDVDVKIDKKYILQNVYGVAKPGEMVAVMGPSGSGKTTLLDCLAGRRTLDSGTVTLNSRPLNKQLRRRISYVLQQDIFLENLTCWESLWFTALLRLPGSMPTSDKKERLMKIVDALDMRKFLNTNIGSPFNRGLSGGEKKRTTIACELLTNPALLLLDEPTSGLDSSTAYDLCSTIKKFAKMLGKTVVVSIHQPSSQVFNMFDKLLLLCDGQMAYFGDIQGCAQHFADLDLPCLPNYNLADHILDVVKGTQDIKAKVIEGANAQRSSHEIKQSLETNGCLNNHTVHSGAEVVSTEPPGGKLAATENFDEMDTDDDHVRYKKEYDAKWPTGFLLQFLVLFRRSAKQSLPRTYSKWHLAQNISLGAFCGALWFQRKALESEVVNRQGLIFFYTIFGSFEAMIDSVLSVIGDRDVVNKERLAGYYRLSAYYLAKTFTGLPMVFGLAVINFTIMYWCSGLSTSFAVYLQFLCILFLAVSVAHSAGGLFVVIFTDVSPTLTTASTMMLVFMVAGGFYTTNLPSWIVWMKYISFVTYTYHAALIVEYTSSQFKCNDMNSIYSSCMFNSSVYNSTTNNTGANEAPTFISQEELLATFTMVDEGWTLYYYVLILIGYSLILMSVTYLLLRFVRKPRIS